VHVSKHLKYLCPKLSPTNMELNHLLVKPNPSNSENRTQKHKASKCIYEANIHDRTTLPKP
jgi:hypothetical protein